MSSLLASPGREEAQLAECAAVLQSRVTAVWTPEHGHGVSQRQQGARLHALLRLLVGGHARGQVERQTGQVTVWHNLQKKGVNFAMAENTEYILRR